MPLGEREGDTSKSRFIGVETYFNKSMTVVLDNNIFLEKGCDFVVAPLMSPTYRPSLMQQFGSISVELRLPFTKSDLNPSAKIWNTKVIGKISEWIDLDSPDQTLRKDSETVLKQEIDKAAYLSLQACLLPTPKRNTCANYARCVNQYLQLKGLDQMQLWLRIPLGKPDDNSSAIFRTPADCWKIWNSFRLLCDHHSNLLVTLDNLNALPADNSLNSWYGEPVSAFIIHTDCFFTTGDDENVKHLSKNLQKSITYFLDHSTQIIISEDRVNYKEMEEYCFDTCSVAGTDHRIHRLHPYMDCVRSLYQQLDPLSERERSLFAFRDDLQPTVQPFKDTLEYVAYQNSDDDEKKFTKVSDLLGSFGDNELAPESLDGAQRFLKKDGISIPSSYTSFLQPVTAWKLHSAIKAKEDILRFETAYMAKMHNVARLAPSQPLFTFTHPKSSNKESNNRYRNLQFVIPESAVVHGFAGYFDATLYKDVHLGTEPTKATPGVITWDDHYFPLREPICVHRGSTLEVNFWRCCDYTKVWYEWCVTSPSPSLVHNCNARADCMWLN
ncbi:protein arginine N-methyltransferase 1.5-like isoform X4 [Cicer arietinum]|uniref:protein arginine N-methyltransferase 1.5-like isoform X4 n=1 Tax=Cicer arietinum TaxID=3827 RepID=UPI003CC54CE6